jgi:hypothetical protein
MCSELRLNKEEEEEICAILNHSAFIFLEYLIIDFEIVHGLFLCPLKKILHTLKFICELQIERINCPFC